MRAVCCVLAEVGVKSEHITCMTWCLTDKREYIARGKEIAAVVREMVDVFRAATSALQVSGLIEDRATVEIEVPAVLPMAP